MRTLKSKDLFAALRVVKEVGIKDEMRRMAELVKDGKIDTKEQTELGLELVMNILATQWVRHYPAYAGPDYVHFTPAGAKLVGETLSRSLLTYYDFYDLRKTLPAAAVQQRMGR